MPPSSSGLGRRPLTPETGVRVPLGVPVFLVGVGIAVRLVWCGWLAVAVISPLSFVYRSRLLPRHARGLREGALAGRRAVALASLRSGECGGWISVLRPVQTGFIAPASLCASPAAAEQWCTQTAQRAEAATVARRLAPPPWRPKRNFALGIAASDYQTQRLHPNIISVATRPQTPTMLGRCVD